MNATSPAVASRAARVGRMLGRVALVVGVLCAVAALLAGPAYRTETLPLGASLQTMRWSATVAIGGAVAAVVAMLLSLSAPGPLRGRGISSLALLVNALVAAPLLFMYWQAQHLPKIHDISTDTVNPPTFVAVLPLRESARNAVAYPPSTAAEQRKGYPDIRPLTLPMAPQMAFERALQVARAMGWEVRDGPDGPELVSVS